MSLVAEEISRKATELLRGKGQGQFVRAIDVALALIPNYQRETDDRNFENRVYAILKRRPNEFVRIGKGQWTLKEYGGLPGLHTDDDEWEPPTFEKPVKHTSHSG